MDELIGKRYGTALFEVAQERNEPDRMQQDIQTALQTIKENPDFIKILMLPSVLIDKKKALVKEAFGDNLNKDLMGLLLLTIDKGRQGHIEKILEYAMQAINDEKGILTAHITSAVELTEAEKAEWKAKLSAQTQKRVELNCKVDSSLIGGVVVRIKDQILDHTIKNELHNLAKKLYTVKISD